MTTCPPDNGNPAALAKGSCKNKFRDLEWASRSVEGESVDGGTGSDGLTLYTLSRSTLGTPVQNVLLAFRPGHRNCFCIRANTPLTRFSFGALLLLLALSTHAQTTGSVTLGWSPDSDPNVAGYNLYQGVSSGNYTNLLAVGNKTNATVSGLATGVRYFFALTAYATDGLESPFSNEISYTPSNSPTSLPVVVLTSPNNDSSYTAPATVSLAATVTPNGNAITEVQFFNGSTLLGNALSPPYSFSWSNIGAGSYTLSARAIYGSGSSVSSPLCSVTVTNPVGILPPPWQVVDIGNVGSNGTVSVSGAGFTLTGAGNMSSSSDDFQFVYQPMTGDGDLRARIISPQNTNAYACAGIMIRETLNPSAKDAFLGISPGGTIYSKMRTRTAKSTSVATISTATPPSMWARLVRSGNTISGYTAPDGVNWTLVASKSIYMATGIYFGLAVASGSPSTLATATFTNIVAVP